MQARVKRQKLDASVEFSPELLVLVSKHLYITDWMSFLRVSKAYHKYFSDDSVWSDWEIRPDFLHSCTGFTKLLKIEQCKTLIALREAKNIYECLRRLSEMPDSVKALVLCNVFEAYDLIDNSDRSKEYSLRDLKEYDEVMPVVRTLDSGASYRPVYMNNGYVKLPTTFLQMVQVGLVRRFESHERIALPSLLHKFLLGLRTLPFRRRPNTE